MSSTPRVVIVGAGFAGMWAAKKLAKAPVEVLLVDRNNYHSFFPLLYQVAAAELAPADIAYPIRTIFRRQKNFTFRLGEVRGVDVERGVVVVDDEHVPYDFLIFAPGSVTRWFGVDGAEEHAFPLRTLDEGLRLRNHLLRTFEAAAASESEDERRRLLTFTIVGGGPTGVEFAGALQELLRGPFARDFPELSAGRARVVLLEAADRVLGTYPDRLSAYASRRLDRMGVEVRLGATVESVAADAAMVAGEKLPTATVVWTAGVGGTPEYEAWGLPLGPSATVEVDPDLRVRGRPTVFVTGDLAFNDAEPTPMVAQNAIQQGKHAAAQIRRILADQPTEPFGYTDFGNMAVIGRNAAVVHLFNRLPFTGFIAWGMWLTIHLAKLVGFRNRLAALVSWTGDYVFGDRSARLLIPGQAEARTTSVDSADCG